MGCSWKKRRHSRNVLKGLAAGAVAGLAASWAMNQYQKAWSAASSALANSTNGKSDKASEHSGEQDPTITIADKISRTVRGRSLRKREQKKAGTLVHYAFGSVVGGLYGATVEMAPAVKSAAGMSFGSSVFAGMDEIALPLLNLAKAPGEYPISRHLYGLSSHLVYGLTTELVRFVLRDKLDL